MSQSIDRTTKTLKAPRRRPDQHAASSSSPATVKSNKPVKKAKLPASLKGGLAGTTAAYDENERIHILMAICLARYLDDQELTSDPKPIFSETLCTKIRDIIKWPYFASKVRPRGANPVPSNNAIRHIWYCLQTHGTANRPKVKPKRKKNIIPQARIDFQNCVQHPHEGASVDKQSPTQHSIAPANWPMFGRDFI